MKQTCITLLLLISIFIFADQKTDVAISAENMIGEWQGYVVNKNEMTFQTPYRYVFNSDGTWSIREPAGQAMQQGWFKIHSDQLWLQPLEAAKKETNSAITAMIVNETQLELPNPLDENLKLLLIKESALPHVEREQLSGAWRIKQKSLSTGEVKTAPFELHFLPDGRYQVVQGSEKLSSDWSKGTFELTDRLIVLKNTWKDGGLWQNPVFFWFNDQINYNNSQYRLWGEKLTQTSLSGESK